MPGKSKDPVQQKLRDHKSKWNSDVSSFISKLLTAQSDVIEMYGTGNPLRQFTYANDIVEIVKIILWMNVQ